MKRTEDYPIVVGLARDERSDHAVTLGAGLAAALEVPLAVTHTVPQPVNPWVRLNRLHRAAANGLAITGAWQKQSEHLAALLAETPLRDTPVEDVLRISCGHTARVLLDAAHQRAATAIVLGPHRERGVLDFGRTARSVLALSPCPVWVQTEAPRPIERILVGVDLTESSRHTLAFAVRFALALGAEVRVEHCFVDPPSSLGPDPGMPVPGPPIDLTVFRRSLTAELEHLVAQATNGSGVEASCVVVDEPPVAHLLEAARPTDLLVVGTHGGTRLPGSVLGTVSYALLRAAPVATVAVPDPAHQGASRLLPRTTTPAPRNAAR